MHSQQLVLAIDDEPGILKLLRTQLSNEGFRVATASSGEEALSIAEEQRPDIVLLDLMMPGMSGLEIMSALRARSDVPVVLVTAKGDDQDKVRGLELGADDYLAKPFRPDELFARIRAVLRRSVRGPEGEHIVRTRGQQIDLQQRSVMRDGRDVQLTRTEWQLLQVLAMSPGKLLLNSELLTKVWGPEYRDDLQYLRVWVSRLRRKLEDDPAHPTLIKTFQGIGYMFDPDESSAAEDREALAVEN
ncbi:MAG TPA: response regulator transcription factor [Burkholderiales bacterium]|nr:response regulator transcription factor [Burkholderiales bacterium]